MNLQQNPITTVTVANPQVVEFLRLLGSADIVIADSPALNGWETSEATGDPDNQIASFSWIDGEGQRCGLQLAEGAVASGKWAGESFFCLDIEGDEVQISLYKSVPLTPSTKRGNGRPVSSLALARDNTAFLACHDDVASVLREHAVCIHDAGGLSINDLAYAVLDDHDLHLDAISLAAAAEGDDEEARRRAAHREIAQQLVDVGFLKGRPRALRVNVLLTTGNRVDDRYGLQGLYEITFAADVSHLSLGQRATLALEVHNASTQIRDYDCFAVSVLDPAGYTVTPEPVGLDCSGSMRKLGDPILHQKIRLKEWTGQMYDLAHAEGWGVFECDGSANGPWQICKNDHAEVGADVILVSDDIAWKIVMEGHKPHHEAARAFIQQNNPLEWAAMSRYMAGERAVSEARK
ncbi:hypothetical protein [Burkholderia sp. Ac-20365]|uniref:hypothetical protein n=1 Tax=Burkholderia sp. Ac-20365 TaxID=2703897 RepID=UPI00197B09C7|nr:hypothetical protein [Burkholderia sp. Ac-20365]MBN3761362.1 hypothetical protein [Burkholderia sp. Ac-20365]